MPISWPARITLILYVILLTLVAVNLALVLEWPVWPAVLAPVASVAALAVSRLTAGTRRALYHCLLTLGTIGLAAVALVLAVPAWQVIADGASGSWAGRMAPLFVAALALHACNLWVATAVSGEQDERLERLARLFYGPAILPSLITALILCASLVLAMELLARGGEEAEAVTRRLLERGIIPPLTVLLFFWGTLLLLGKWWNGWYLRRVLARWRTTEDDAQTFSPEGEGGPESGLPPLSAALRSLSGGGVGMNANSAPASFSAGLDALIENPSGLDEGLQVLWRRHEESWLLPRYISWAVPILGFIGTVLGISLAAEGIRRIIASDAGLASLSSDLDGAIAPLGIAFDTTLIALSLSVVLTLVLALVQRAEERLLSNLEQRVREVVRGG